MQPLAALVVYLQIIICQQVLICVYSLYNKSILKVALIVFVSCNPDDTGIISTFAQLSQFGSSYWTKQTLSPSGEWTGYQAWGLFQPSGPTDTDICTVLTEVMEYNMDDAGCTQQAFGSL